MSCYADPVGYELYYNRNQAGEDPYWCCCRGTNRLEGYHSHHAHRLSGGNNGLDLATRVWTDHTHTWNMHAAVKSHAVLQELGVTDMRVPLQVMV
jgi:hypothetical protein